MWMLNILKLIVTGTLGAAGFAVLFGIKLKHVPVAAVGGLIATAVYVFMDLWGANLFLSNFLATIVCVIYANIFARVLKTPSIVFITASIIPLVPGGSLFYTMSNIILGDGLAAKTYGLNTLQVALGIAGGIVIESLVVSVMLRISQAKLTKKRLDADK
ncbi:MAG: threonine/serine exporter family protein [Clostridia bacterium]|nr:threonine/serine exporter family protein [Clostridia bacterium]